MNPRKKKFISLAAASLFLLIIAVADFFTHYRISFMLFYLIPIFLVSWNAGWRLGIATCIISASSWLWADLHSGYEYASPLFPYWNAIVRAFYFSFVVLGIELKKSLVREQEQTRIDHLTGVTNRKYFYDVAAKELERCRRYRHPFTLAFLDCDNFKLVNDNFGHQSGDAVLRLVARAIKGRIRVSDTVARFGGDEFVILLIETRKDSAIRFIPRLQKYLVKVMQEAGWQITFSIGAVTYITPPESIQEAIKRADDLMYAVKQSGKDAVKYEVFDASGQYVWHR